jgi:hypothetical protein
MASGIIIFMLGVLVGILILAVFVAGKDRNNFESADVLYICDRKAACSNGEHCNVDWCNYTADISHAVNFKKAGSPHNIYVERFEEGME